jgi:hypothetical protein
LHLSYLTIIPFITPAAWAIRINRILSVWARFCGKSRIWLGFEPVTLVQEQVVPLRSKKNPIIPGQRGTLSLMLRDINKYGIYTSFEVGYTEDGKAYYKADNGNPIGFEPER